MFIEPTNPTLARLVWMPIEENFQKYPEICVHPWATPDGQHVERLLFLPAEYAERSELEFMRAGDWLYEYHLNR